MNDYDYLKAEPLASWIKQWEVERRAAIRRLHPLETHEEQRQSAQRQREEADAHHYKRWAQGYPR